MTEINSILSGGSQSNVFGEDDDLENKLDNNRNEEQDLVETSNCFKYGSGSFKLGSFLIKALIPFCSIF